MDENQPQRLAAEDEIEKYRADSAMFERSHPDFKAAYEFFMCARAAELKAIGYDTPQALHQALVAEELVIVQMAFRDDRSPAEVIYGLAHARGFTTSEIPRPTSLENPIAALKGRQRAGTARQYTIN